MSMDQLLALKLHLSTNPKFKHGETTDLNRQEFSENQSYAPGVDEVDDHPSWISEIQSFLSDVLVEQWPFVVKSFSAEVVQYYNPDKESFWQFGIEDLALTDKWFAISWNYHEGGEVMGFKSEADMFKVLNEFRRRSGMRAAAAA